MFSLVSRKFLLSDVSLRPSPSWVDAALSHIWMSTRVYNKIPPLSFAHRLLLQFRSSHPHTVYREYWDRVGSFPSKNNYLCSFYVYLLQVILFEIDYAIFYMSVHKLNKLVNSSTYINGQLMNIMSSYGWYEKSLR